MITNGTTTCWQDLEKKIEFLSKPSSYPDRTTAVECIETHMSRVFLTDRYAYKLKKPVDLAFVDFTTLESRRISAKRELHLNQRLAPGVYLDVLPLLADKNNQMRIGTGDAWDDDEEVIEWLLKMQRLPRHLMLDQAIATVDLQDENLHRAVRILAGFYRDTGQVVIASGDYREMLIDKIDANLEALSLPRYKLDREQLDAVHEAQYEQLESHAELFDQRVIEGRIVDGHGDLRPEHICLTSPPVIIDRHELDPWERVVDPVDELSFLSMECSLAGRPGVGEVFFDIYRELSGDNFPEELPVFFKSLRACTRAKFSIWHVDDPQVNDKDRWQDKAERYLELSRVILG